MIHVLVPYLFVYTHTYLSSFVFENSCKSLIRPNLFLGNMHILFFVRYEKQQVNTNGDVKVRDYCSIYGLSCPVARELQCSRIAKCRLRACVSFGVSPGSCAPIRVGRRGKGCALLLLKNALSSNSS